MLNALDWAEGELVTSREVGPGIGEVGISGQLEFPLVAGGRLRGLVGVDCVEAAGEFGWVVHSETGPSWPVYGWPRGASGRLTPGWRVPSASSSPCTGSKTVPTGLVGDGQCGDYSVGAQAQEDDYESHFCWSWGRLQISPDPQQPHTLARPERPQVTGAVKPATRVERCHGASAGPVVAPIYPQLPQQPEVEPVLARLVARQPQGPEVHPKGLDASSDPGQLPVQCPGPGGGTDWGAGAVLYKEAGRRPQGLPALPQGTVVLPAGRPHLGLPARVAAAEVVMVGAPRRAQRRTLLQRRVRPGGHGTEGQVADWQCQASHVLEEVLGGYLVRDSHLQDPLGF